MPIHREHILILADIEGSSGCLTREACAFKTPAWALACAAMTADVNAVGSALCDARARVTVKDFHRTGYNLMPEGIDPRVEVISGYRRGPVAGIGDPSGYDALMMLGMHAPSGSRGFMAHTLTSRIASLEINGRLVSEAQLFAGAVAPWGLRPLFFSGCPEACAQASAAIPGMLTVAIDKTRGVDVEAWRQGLAATALASLRISDAQPYILPGPLNAVVRMRAGAPTAARLAQRWNLPHNGGRVYITARDLPNLYHQLVRICYLTPLTAAILPISLFLSNLRGRLGLRWARRHIVATAARTRQANQRTRASV